MGGYLSKTLTFTEVAVGQWSVLDTPANDDVLLQVVVELSRRHMRLQQIRSGERKEVSPRPPGSVGSDGEAERLARNSADFVLLYTPFRAAITFASSVSAKGFFTMQEEVGAKGSWKARGGGVARGDSWGAGGAAGGSSTSGGGDVPCSSPTSGSSPRSSSPRQTAASPRPAGSPLNGRTSPVGARAPETVGQPALNLPLSRQEVHNWLVANYECSPDRLCVWSRQHSLTSSTSSLSSLGGTHGALLHNSRAAGSSHSGPTDDRTYTLADSESKGPAASVSSIDAFLQHLQLCLLSGVRQQQFSFAASGGHHAVEGQRELTGGAGEPNSVFYCIDSKNFMVPTSGGTAARTLVVQETRRCINALLHWHLASLQTECTLKGTCAKKGNDSRVTSDLPSAGPELLVGGGSAALAAAFAQLTTPAHLSKGLTTVGSGAQPSSSGSVVDTHYWDAAYNVMRAYLAQPLSHRVSNNGKSFAILSHGSGHSKNALGLSGRKTLTALRQAAGGAFDDEEGQSSIREMIEALEKREGAPPLTAEERHFTQLPPSAIVRTMRRKIHHSDSAGSGWAEDSTTIGNDSSSAGGAGGGSSADPFLTPHPPDGLSEADASAMQLALRQRLELDLNRLMSVSLVGGDPGSAPLYIDQIRRERDAQQKAKDDAEAKRRKQECDSDEDEKEIAGFVPHHLPVDELPQLVSAAHANTLEIVGSNGGAIAANTESAKKANAWKQLLADSSAASSHHSHNGTQHQSLGSPSGVDGTEALRCLFTVVAEETTIELFQLRAKHLKSLSCFQELSNSFSTSAPPRGMSAGVSPTAVALTASPCSHETTATAFPSGARDVLEQRQQLGRILHDVTAAYSSFLRSAKLTFTNNSQQQQHRNGGGRLSPSQHSGVPNQGVPTFLFDTNDGRTIRVEVTPDEQYIDTSEGNQFSNGVSTAASSPRRPDGGPPRFSSLASILALRLQDVPTSVEGDAQPVVSVERAPAVVALLNMRRAEQLALMSSPSADADRRLSPELPQYPDIMVGGPASGENVPQSPSRSRIVSPTQATAAGGSAFDAAAQRGYSGETEEETAWREWNRRKAHLTAEAENDRVQWGMDAECRRCAVGTLRRFLRGESVASHLTDEDLAAQLQAYEDAEQEVEIKRRSEEELARTAGKGQVRPPINRPTSSSQRKQKPMVTTATPFPPTTAHERRRSPVEASGRISPVQHQPSSKNIAVARPLSAAPVRRDTVRSSLSTVLSPSHGLEDSRYSPKEFASDDETEAVPIPRLTIGALASTGLGAMAPGSRIFSIHQQDSILVTSSLFDTMLQHSTGIETDLGKTTTDGDGTADSGGPEPSAAPPPPASHGDDEESLTIPQLLSIKGTGALLQHQWTDTLKPPVHPSKVLFALTSLLDVDFRQKATRRRLHRLGVIPRLIALLDSKTIVQRARIKASRVLLALVNDVQLAREAYAADVLVMAHRLLSELGSQITVGVPAGVAEATVLCLLFASLHLNLSRFSRPTSSAQHGGYITRWGAVFAAILNAVEHSPATVAFAGQQLRSAALYAAGALLLSRASPSSTTAPPSHSVGSALMQALHRCLKVSQQRAAVSWRQPRIQLLATLGYAITNPKNLKDCAVPGGALPSAILIEFTRAVHPFRRRSNGDGSADPMYRLSTAGGGGGETQSRQSQNLLADAELFLPPTANTAPSAASDIADVSALEAALISLHSVTQNAPSPWGRSLPQLDSLVELLSGVLCTMLSGVVHVGDVDSKVPQFQFPSTVLPVVPRYRAAAEDQVDENREGSRGSDDDHGSQDEGSDDPTGGNGSLTRSLSRNPSRITEEDAASITRSTFADEEDNPFTYLDTAARTLRLVHSTIASLHLLLAHTAEARESAIHLVPLLLRLINIDSALFPLAAVAHSAETDTPETVGIRSPLYRLVIGIRVHAAGAAEALTSIPATAALVEREDGIELLLRTLRETSHGDLAVHSAGIVAQLSRHRNFSKNRPLVRQIGALLTRSNWRLRAEAVTAFAHMSAHDAPSAERIGQTLMGQLGTILLFLKAKSPGRVATPQTLRTSKHPEEAHHGPSTAADGTPEDDPTVLQALRESSCHLLSSLSQVRELRDVLTESRTLELLIEAVTEHSTELRFVRHAFSAMSRLSDRRENLDRLAACDPLPLGILSFLKVATHSEDHRVALELCQRLCTVPKMNDKFLDLGVVDSLLHLLASPSVLVQQASSAVMLALRRHFNATKASSGNATATNGNSSSSSGGGGGGKSMARTPGAASSNRASSASHAKSLHPSHATPTAASSSFATGGLPSTNAKQKKASKYSSRPQQKAS